MKEYTTERIERQEGRTSVFPFMLSQLEPLLSEILEKLTWISLELNRLGPALEDALCRLEDSQATADDIERLEAEIKDIKLLLNDRKVDVQPRRKLPKPEGYV